MTGSSRDRSPRKAFGKRLPSPPTLPGLRLGRRPQTPERYTNTDYLTLPPDNEKRLEFRIKSEDHEDHVSLAQEIYDALIKDEVPAVYLRCSTSSSGALFWAVKVLTLIYNLLQGVNDVICTPDKVDGDYVVLKCFLHTPLDKNWTMDGFKLRVASDSHAARVATSVKVTFLKGRKCFLVACGWDPVKVAVLSMFYTQRFLQEDWWKGVVIGFRPRYVELAGCKGIELAIMFTVPRSYEDAGTGSDKCCSVWINNIDTDLNDKELFDELSKHGSLDAVRPLTDPNGVRYAYANFKTPELCSAALKALDGAEIGKQKIEAKFARTLQGERGGLPAGKGRGGGGKKRSSRERSPARKRSRNEKKRSRSKTPVRRPKYDSPPRKSKRYDSPPQKRRREEEREPSKKKYSSSELETIRRIYEKAREQSRERIIQELKKMNEQSKLRSRPKHQPVERSNSESSSSTISSVRSALLQPPSIEYYKSTELKSKPKKDPVSILKKPLANERDYLLSPPRSKKHSSSQQLAIVESSSEDESSVEPIPLSAKRSKLVKREIIDHTKNTYKPPKQRRSPSSDSASSSTISEIPKHIITRSEPHKRVIRDTAKVQKEERTPKHTTLPKKKYNVLRAAKTEETTAPKPRHATQTTSVPTRNITIESSDSDSGDSRSGGSKQYSS